VIDVENEIRSELERLAPADERMADAWEEVLARSGPQRSPRRRVRLLVAVPALVLAVAAPTLALSAGVRSFLGMERPRPVVTEAELVLSSPVGNRFHAHLWHAPSTTGGRCSFLSVDHRRTPPRVPQANGGGACTARGTAVVDRAVRAHPLTVGLSISRRLRSGDPAKWVPPIVSGNVHPSLRAARVRVEWRGGSLPLVLDGGYFLGGGPQLYVPPFERFPFFVVAYDAGGREVARKRLESPSLRMLNGWKEYAREYHRWERTSG
jgi:hypothetical protein